VATVNSERCCPMGYRWEQVPDVAETFMGWVGMDAAWVVSKQAVYCDRCGRPLRPDGTFGQSYEQLEAERDAARRQAEVLAEVAEKAFGEPPCDACETGACGNDPTSELCDAADLKQCWLKYAAQAQDSGAESKYDPDETPIPRTWEQVRGDTSGAEPQPVTANSDYPPDLSETTGPRTVRATYRVSSFQQARAIRRVVAERKRQDAKFGDQSGVSRERMLCALMEEVGEVAEAILDNGKPRDLLAELVQVAALAVQMIEHCVVSVEPQPATPAEGSE